MQDLNTLIRECKAGNQLAHEIIYKKFYRVLYTIALRYCRTTFEAEDILQDSFVKIFRNIHRFETDKGSFEGWVKRIVQNTAINNYRSNLKYNGSLDISHRDREYTDDSFDALFEALEAKEIITLLNEMPVGYRMIINLYCIDGYSHKEISEMLGISTGTSKSQLHKGKQYLKSVLENQLKLKVDER